ncbi:MAG: hypothetical protein ACRC5M_06035 [Anaeroplasmataceae bacterium]
MKTYKQFHGNIEQSNIGKELRNINKLEKSHFKVLTGYGSTSGTSASKSSVLKSLSIMKKEGLIKGFLPGEVKHQILKETSLLFNTKLEYEHIIKKDQDYGNDGIIFIFK